MTRTTETIATKANTQKKFNFTSIHYTKATDEELEYAWKNKIPIIGIHTFPTHHSPHMDETAAIVILKTTPEGRKLFPGIQNAAPVSISTTKLREIGGLGFDGFIRLLSKGCLPIGVGGGPLDEHDNRQKKVSCLELVKNHLDLYQKKENRVVYGPLIEYVNAEDNHGDNLIQNLNRVNPGKKLERSESEMLKKFQTGMMANTLKKGYETLQPDDDQGFLNVFNTGVNFIMFHIEQAKMFQAAADEFDTNKERIKSNSIALPGQGSPLFVILKSDNVLMGKVLRNKIPTAPDRRLGMTLLIKRTPTENGGLQFVLMANDEFKDCMVDIKKIIDQKISFKRTGKGLPFRMIGKFGTLDAIPEIYFDESQKIIMNGSKTDPDAPGIIGVDIEIQDIIDAVDIVCNKRYDTKHSKKCQTGSCPAKEEDKRCVLFAYCLSNCAKVQEK